MMYCPSHDVVFVAIPKTGTRSIYYILKNQYGGKLYKEHLPVIPKQFIHYFSFCVVRNPYDRICSAYWSLCHRQGDRYGYKGMFAKRRQPNTLVSFLDAIKLDFQRRRRELPQYKFHEENRIDQILRYETLQEDFNTLPFLTNPVTLPRSNSTTEGRTKATPKPRPPWEQLVTVEAGQMINEMFAKDFKLFNYKKKEFK